MKSEMLENLEKLNAQVDNAVEVINGQKKLLAEYEIENEQRKEQLTILEKRIYTLKLKNASLENKVEKMKCCWNCKHNVNENEDNEICWNCERSCAKFGEEIIKDEWEMK